MPREYDVEACDLFLSCMINDPAGVPLFADRLDKDDFPFGSGKVWETMCHCVLVDWAEPTLHELAFRLEKEPQGLATVLEVIGKDYLESLPGLMIEKGIRSPLKAELFFERIEQSTHRSLLHGLYQAAEEALAKKVLNFDEWWADAQCHIEEKRVKSRGMGAVPLGKYWGKLEPAIEAWLAGEPYMRVTTGLRKLDAALGGGLLRKELHIIGGRPGTTKTTLALTMSKKQAAQGLKVGWASLEMPGEMLLLRLLCMEASVDWSRLMSGGYKGQAASIRRGLEKARKRLPTTIYVDDRAGMTSDDIRLQALRLSMTHGIDVMYVDFIQLLKDLGQDEMIIAKKVFRHSKEIGKLLDIPFVAISQLRKGVDVREDKLPQAADVPYSGDDIAGFILLTWDLYKYRRLGQIKTAYVPGLNDVDGDRIDCDDPSAIYYVLAKARYAAEKIFKMNYDRELGRITDPGGFSQGIEAEAI